jgi:mRNA interferase MazF
VKTVQPSLGDIWFVDLNPTRGREQSGKRPAMVISVDAFNHGPAELIVVLPLTTKDKQIPFHVPITPPEGGLAQRSYIKCEDVRSVSKDRLMSRLGSVSIGTILSVQDRLRILLSL